jgi:tetratricopeptide (TPR) repeat protein
MAGMTILFYAARAEQERWRAEAQQQRAEGNLRQLIEATERFVSESDWKLSWLPYTLEERRKLLQGFHQTLARLSQEEHRRPEVRLTSIKIAQRIGDLAYYTGTLAEAETWLLGALDDVRRGLSQQPGDAELLAELALNHSKRGKVEMALGRWEQARALFNDSLRLLETQGTGRDAVNQRRTLAVSLSELAELEFAAGRFDAAAALFDQAIALHEQNPGTYNESLLARTLGFRGEVAHRMGDVAMAERQFERALRLGRNCVRSHEGEQFHHWVLARVLTGLGALQSARGQFEAAEGHFREVQALGRTLLQGEPPNKRFALVLADGLREHEAMARRRGALAEADRLQGELCALVRDFRRQDGQDVRFHTVDCQGTRP